MSAYGAISAPTPIAELTSRLWPIPSGSVSTHPISFADAPEEMMQYMYEVFAKELEDGLTYPQEGPFDFEAFKTYFFKTASTTVIAVLQEASMKEPPSSLMEAQAERSWRECLGGFYYIKPNYPGRSSHNCNAGFVVPPIQRGKKIGGALAESYLIYAPALGYRGSVFNLVYENNAASLRLWDKLGFQRVGKIPRAGRLRSGPNGTEEYIDAVVVFKSFV
ncbi:hypothetical protein BD324DRAFT_661160 [Kockovaella imperatae]|uniref:N-acetyltransferase domain-containing protein n=1 Tax=Kockovaella imperatae TaxID=4999 RepID=A0A1Y1UFE3_9TREE|nr:hypothetical protein BD324DRAFT_661160 [Kockovaella imperatae]ORX35795.1 hypothetical protein BD324DRAFT_661160 [Kockovaella imperatae]